MKDIKKTNFKIVLSFFIYLTLWGAVCYKLYLIQIQDNKGFQTKAANEQAFQYTIKAPRGVIKTSDGINLAIDIPYYTVYAYTPNIKNIDSFENNVLPIINYGKDKFESNKNAGLHWFKVADDVTLDKKETLEKKLIKENTAGLSFILDEKRSYPNKEFLSQLIGYEDLTKQKGQYGIEGYFNADLKGEEGQIVGNKDKMGDPIIDEKFNVIPPKSGTDITLTIDSFIQKMVEDKLKYWVDKTGADLGSVIIMDPHTGAIISMANYPAFDPNQYYKGFTIDCDNNLFKELDNCKDPEKKNAPLTGDLFTSSFNNSAISNLFEPGSVMKTLTIAAALEEKKATVDTKFNDATGVFKIDGKQIYNYNKQANGQMTMADILNKSSNVGASMVSQLLGSQLMYSYYKKFGIGRPTGITLDGEQSVNLPGALSWKKIDVATASFGQYVDATPLQVIKIYQAMANKGIIMKPYIVKSETKDGKTTEIKPQAEGRVVSEDTVDKVTKMLVFTTQGEPIYGLRAAKMEDYASIIAGKTGTAQVPVSTGGYSDSLINTTYIGFAPANDPKFVMLATLKYPRLGKYAADNAVPLWVDIAKDLFVNYKIHPN